MLFSTNQPELQSYVRKFLPYRTAIEFSLWAQCLSGLPSKVYLLGVKVPIQ